MYLLISQKHNIRKCHISDHLSYYKRRSDRRSDCKSIKTFEEFFNTQLCLLYKGTKYNNTSKNENVHRKKPIT